MEPCPGVQNQLRRFCYQYLQVEHELDFPGPSQLRQQEVQEHLFNRLFADGVQDHPPPERYKLRVLKELVSRIENSIEDWEEFVCANFNFACTLHLSLTRSDRESLTTS